jgi:hypothetical protein
MLGRFLALLNTQSKDRMPSLAFSTPDNHEQGVRPAHVKTRSVVLSTRAVLQKGISLFFSPPNPISGISRLRLPHGF